MRRRECGGIKIVHILVVSSGTRIRLLRMAVRSVFEVEIVFRFKN